MKRKFISLIFILIFLGMSSLAFAIEEDNQETEEDSSGFFDIKEKQTEFGAIKGDLDDEVVNIFEKEITFPKPIQFFARIILGIKKGETISIERLITLIGIWIALFAIIHATIGIIPMFAGSKIKLAASAIIVTLIAITGTINTLTIIYFEYMSTLENLNLGPFKFMLGIGVALAIAFIATKFAGMLNDRLVFEKAEVTGKNIAMSAKMGKIQSDSLNKWKEYERKKGKK